MEPEVGALDSLNDHLTWEWEDFTWPETASEWLMVLLMNKKKYKLGDAYLIILGCTARSSRDAQFY